MPDVSAGERTRTLAVDTDRLTLLYVIYGDRLVRNLRARLGAQWQLAEDIAQDTWEIVTSKLHTCRASDDKAFPWIVAVARSMMSKHFNRTREMATDLATVEDLLPYSASAEDTAITRIIAAMLAADSPAPLGVGA